MKNPSQQFDKKWDGPHHPRPDYLSSSRKRLAPQLLYKGGILNAWGKKMAVAVDTSFFGNLPDLPETTNANADIAWMVYGLDLDQDSNRYLFKKHQTVFTSFAPALETLTRTQAGSIDEFVEHLQQKLDEKLENGYPPIAPTLLDDADE